jgi:phosphatidylethanolamine/phosphatidyl-N-methylethanolamine N-methyltransferase
MEIEDVRASYRRWAPVYDATFGAITGVGRRRVVEHVNQRSGSVLEVGVGTGLSLPGYGTHLRVTGVDYSGEMLARARERVIDRGLDHVVGLREMDARALDFPDNSFDTVVAMYLVSVVPEPERVVAQMARVCRPGGEVVILNHFARDEGTMARVERAFAPFADKIGWHSDFSMDRVLGCGALKVVETRSAPPFGLFTLLRFVKRGHADA